MLFLTHWELNESMSEVERLKFVQKVISSKLFPPEGVEVVRWDTTPDGWGILITKAESAADVIRSLDVWRMAEGGFFKSTRTAPTMPIEEAMPIEEELAKALE